MSLQSDYVKATLDAHPLIYDGEWEERCDAWIKKSIRLSVLEELEAKAGKIVCVTNIWVDEDGKEFKLETIDAAALRSLLAQMKKEG